MCDRYEIQLHHSSPYCPQGNGQAEATNKTLIKILKKTCESHKFSDWLEKLIMLYGPIVLLSEHLLDRPRMS